MIDYSILMENLHTGFIDLIVAGVGAAVSSAGLFGSNKAAKKAERASRREAKLQRAVGAIQQQANDVQYQAGVRLSGISRQQENLRKEAVIFESARQRRQIAREVQVARATAVQGAANSGGSFSTGLQGVLGSIQQQGDEQGTSLFENTRRALQNFSLNERAANIQSATNRTLSNLNRSAAALGGQINTTQVQARNAQADQSFYNTLFSTGIQIMGANQTGQNVYNSLFGSAPAVGSWTTTVNKA